MKRTALRNMKILVLGLAVLALGACSSAPTRLYSGPALPAQETAVVTNGPYTDIVAVDGVVVSSERVALLPGRHTVGMRPSEQLYNDYDYYGPGNYIFWSRVDGEAEFMAEPGHVYQVYANMTAAPPGTGYGNEGNTRGSPSGFVWTGYVTDKTAHKRVAATKMLPLEAWPRGFSTGGRGFFPR
jgi:hypothetical protein